MEEGWFDEELSGCRLGDGRLDRRLRQLVQRMDCPSIYSIAPPNDGSAFRYRHNFRLN